MPAGAAELAGEAIDLCKFDTRPASPLAALLRRRHSTRSFDERGSDHPGGSGVVSRRRRAHPVGGATADDDDDDDGGSATEIAARPYPSGGASYELELYLAVDTCEGLARGFYHYDAARHALIPIEVSERRLEAMLADAQRAMGAPAAPQILVTMAARFGRVSWKYSSFAYALILKHVGVLMQTFYLMATEMELGACAIGVEDIDLFAKMTGIEFHVEGSVGQIAIGRSVDGGSNPVD